MYNWINGIPGYKQVPMQKLWRKENFYYLKILVDLSWSVHGKVDPLLNSGIWRS